MQKESDLMLSRKAGYLWVLVNSIGINMALCSGSVDASNLVTYLIIVFVIACLCWIGQWPLLQKKARHPWRWIIASIGGWFLSFGAIAIMYVLALDFLNEATERLGGVIDTIFFVLIVLSVGPLIMIITLVIADVRFKMIR